MRVSASIVFLLVSISIACTGYAVFADKAWYGMNFDYPPESNIRFNVAELENGRVFTIQFFNNDRMTWVPTAGMNEHGIFSSLQYQCPMIEGTASLSEDQLYIYQLYSRAVSSCTSIDEIERIIESYELVNMYDLTLHTLIADLSGNALIAEAGDGENLITRINGHWIVMTNFKNADFINTPPDEIVGVGDERHRRALAYIEQHYSSFGLPEAIGTLEAALNTDPVWSTKASMIYDPMEGTVYIGIDGDLERIWTLSIHDGTIQTWSGFTKERSASVRGYGITVPEMRTWI